MDRCPQTRRLVFDSVFYTYLGVNCYIRVFSGELKTGAEMLLMGTNQPVQIKEVRDFTPRMVSTGTLTMGKVGFIITNTKNVSEIKIQDTVTHLSHQGGRDVA